MKLFLLIFLGITIPFLGTFLGAGGVFFFQSNRKNKSQSILSGFAAGVMLASLFWSLLTPALADKNDVFFVTLGFLFGMGSFILSEVLLEKIGQKHHISGKKKMVLAVTLHNLPEGMAVGIAFACAKNGALSIASAFVLAIGIALQNFPEGAIISSPLHSLGISKKKAFLLGTLSGVVEPLGAIFSLFLTSFSQKLLPFILSFAAGAMMFVVSDELIPSLKGKEKNNGLWGLTIGFLVMMALDVVFG